MSGPAASGPGEHLRAALEGLGRGDLARAAREIEAFRKIDPRHPEGFHIAGLIAFQRGELAAATELLKAAVDAGSRNPAHHANLGLVLKAAGRFSDAVAAYGKAIELAPQNAAAWNDRGTARSAAGDAQGAIADYRKALEINPLEVRAAVNLTHALVDLGRPQDALKQAEGVLRGQANLAPALDGRGRALQALDRFDEAAEAFRAAADAAPGDASPLANLAAMLEEINQPEVAATVAEEALARQPGHPHASLILAKCRRRSDALEDAVGLLESLPRDGLPPPLRRDIAFELARLHDRTGRAGDAFAAMEEGNRQSLAAEGEDESLGDQFLDVVSDLAAWATPAHAHQVAALSQADAPDPVFLVGFPRSGTTLLGQIMDAHSGLTMIEERPMLSRVIERLRAEFGGYPSGMERLGPDHVADLRTLYFEAAEAEAGGPIGGCLVDKFPLHLIHTGLIAALFPNARYVLALRHPCDVVLSCFMQNFRVNAAMANFFSIERAARTYDTVMSLWWKNRVAFGPAFHEVRYEDVVEDFEAQASALLAFLGLEWEDGMRDYADRARERGRIDTPSYHQVTEPIYTRARGRWRRYEEQMAPVLPVLQPWIDAFGYREDGA